MLQSDSCDYSNLYIAVKGKTSVRGTNDANRINKTLTLKNNTLFRSSISKVSNTSVDNAEDLGIVMGMYNLLDYSNNYSMTS